MTDLTPCIGCGQQLRVQPDQAGLLRCPYCAARVALPVASSFRWPKVSRHWLLGGIVLLLAALVGVGITKYLERNNGPVDEPVPFTEPRMHPMDALAGGPPPAGEVGFNTRSGRMPPEPTLPLPDVVHANLFQLAQRAPALQSAGRIAPFLALAGDPATGRFFTADEAGSLHCYSPALQLVGKWELPAPAYLLAFDASSEMLYAAVSRRDRLTISDLGEREFASGDLHAYDVAALLAGKGPTGALRPARTLECNATLSGLTLLDGGKRLVFLRESDTRTEILRVETATLKIDASLPLERRGAARLVRVGAALVALANNELFLIDPVTLEKKLSKRLASPIRGLGVLGPARSTRPAAALTDLLLSGFLPQSAPSLSATLHAYRFSRVAGDRIVLLEQRPVGAFLQVVAVFPDGFEFVSRFAAPFPGRLSFHGGSNGRFFLGTSAVIDGRILAFDLIDPERGWITAWGQAERDPLRVLRGAIAVTPDARHVLSGNGHAFTLSPDERASR